MMTDTGRRNKYDARIPVDDVVCCCRTRDVDAKGNVTQSRNRRKCGRDTENDSVRVVRATWHGMGVFCGVPSGPERMQRGVEKCRDRGEHHHEDVVLC